MKHPKIKKTAKLCCRFLWRLASLQLAILALSIPFLAHRGLRISMLSIIGNLIFTPIFLLFFIISLLFYAFELVGFYSFPLAWLLDIVGNFWSYLTAKGSVAWLVGFPEQPIWFSVLVVLLLFLSVFMRFQSAKGFCCAGRRATPLVAILTIFFSKLLFAPCSPDMHLLFKGRGRVVSIYDNSKVIVVDEGGIASSGNPAKWVEGTLVPQVIKAFGVSKIDLLLIKTPSNRVVRGAIRLVETIPLGAIMLPMITAVQDLETRQLLEQLNSLSARSGCRLIYPDEDAITCVEQLFPCVRMHGSGKTVKSGQGILFEPLEIVFHAPGS